VERGHVDFEGPEATPLEILLQLLLGQGLIGGIDLGIDAFLQHRGLDYVTPEVEVGFAVFVSVEGNFLVGSDWGVVTFEGIIVVVTDSLGQGVLDGGDEFVTGDEVDSVEGGTDGFEGTEVRLVEGFQTDSHEEVVTGYGTVLIGVGHSDEPTTTLEGFLDGGGEDVGENRVLGRVVHYGVIKPQMKFGVNGLFYLTNP
jgi:hypothetical protein